MWKWGKRKQLVYLLGSSAIFDLSRTQSLKKYFCELTTMNYVHATVVLLVGLPNT